MVNVLTTPRLQLRPFTESDAPAMFQLGADPAVMRYIGSAPMQNENEAMLAKAREERAQMIKEAKETAEYWSGQMVLGVDYIIESV